MAVLPITPAQVKLGAGKQTILRSEKSGASLLAGKIAYFDTVARSFKLADSAALATARIKGMCLNDAEPDQPVDICTKGKVIVGVGAAIRPGGTYVVLTNGDMVEENDVLHAIGKFTSVVGVGLANEDIEINPTVSDVQLA